MGLESVELVMAWEEHFDIKISNEVAAQMQTPRRTIAFIDEILKSSGSKRIWTVDEIERDVCMLIVEQLGIKRRDFTLDSKYIEDMGVD